jgi:hypothetical protein
MEDLLMALAAGHGALAFGDTAQTEHYWKLALETNVLLYEHNPLVRPLVGHPAAFYAATAGEVVATAWLGHRFRESRHPLLRRFWWVPQTLGAVGGSIGIAYTRAAVRSCAGCFN